MVTHSVKFAELADDIILMKNGRIAQNGKYKTVCETEEFQDLFRKVQSEINEKDIEEDRKINKDQKKIK